MRWDEYQHIEFELHEGGIRVCRLNRPERLNALNHVLSRELHGLFRDLQDDDEVNVAIITGAGRGFCAGADLSPSTEPEPHSRQGRPPDEVRWRVAEGLVRDILDLEKPVISAVNGPAAGLGATVALLCDVVVMSRTAFVADTHVNVGLTAGDGGATIWPLLVGLNRAKEFLMLGRRITGDRAYELGLANYVVEGDQLMTKALELAREFVAMPVFPMRSTKMTVNRHLRHSVDLALEVGLAYEQMAVRRGSRLGGGGVPR